MCVYIYTLWRILTMHLPAQKVSVAFISCSIKSTFLAVVYMAPHNPTPSS